MQVTEGVNEFVGLQVANFGNHHGQQGVGRDIEGNAKEKIGASLVELATELSVGYVKLEEGMTRR